MTKLLFLSRTALPLLLCMSAAAAAQPPETDLPDAAPAGAASAGADGTEAPDRTAPAEEREVAFSADELIYDSESELVTARGRVRMSSEGNDLSADAVIWNQRTGEVRAEGNVRVTNPAGDSAYGDVVMLTDTLRDGVVDNLLLVLEDGGRLAAIRAERDQGMTTLERAAYTPCAVVDSEGCPKDPTWKITAVRVVHDPVRNRISYEGARLHLFGVPLIGLPGLSHPDGTGGGGSGLLVPDLKLGRNGLEVSVPYYWRIAPNRDLTVTPHVYTDVLPMLEGRYRHLTELGAFQLAGYVTYGSRIRIDPLALPPLDPEREVRAYLEGNGTFQLDRNWTITALGRYVTDPTFLRRYDISSEDRLRSFVNAERITEDSYVSIAGWAFQDLRVGENYGRQPVAVPAIDARWRFQEPILDGRVELQANSLALLRNHGQDTQRAFASARWEKHQITRWGQELTLTGYLRGDVYNTDDSLLAPAFYRGEDGWSSRGIAALAADIRWPFIGRFLHGTQRLTPRVQVVATPPTRNLDIPNEDARAIELEDSNLFALNRFPGYDRWEDGTRITYGLEWAVDLPGAALRTTAGQSYRLNERPAIFPPGTGLSERFSDIVGRTTLKVGRQLSFVHRFRLDKDNLAVRRNEIDAVIGTTETYATIGYLRLDRNIDPTIEDLRDREEIRLAGRIRFATYWSLFGSSVIDLTCKREDPSALADGFEPVRHRIGIAYDDECIEIGVTWRRDYETTGDFERGNTFLFRVALKNLGR